MNPNKNPTQCEAILNFLQNGHVLTALDALELFGCFRLASRIHELNKLPGVTIESKKVEGENGKHWNEYRIAA